MPFIKLQPYKFRIKRNEGKDSLHLDDLDGNKKDFFGILKKYLLGLGSTEIFDSEKKTVSAEDLAFQVEERRIYGFLRSGDYGIEADFFDTESNITIPKARKTKDSEVYPFLFLFHLPVSKDHGFLIIEKIGVHGVKTVFENSMNKYLNSLDLRIVINPIISQPLFEKFQKSRLVELKLIRYQIARDIADRVLDGSPKGVAEMRVFQAKRRKGISLLQYIRDMISNEKITHYELLDEKYDEIKMVIDDEGSRKTITFGEKAKFHESELLGNYTLETGSPSFHFLLKRAIEYMNRILQLYGGNS